MIILQTKEIFTTKEAVPIDSIKKEEETSHKKFDDSCFTELSDIFNKNSKWKSIATSLGYQECIEIWQKLRNPTKVLLIYTEVIAIN